MVLLAVNFRRSIMFTTLTYFVFSSNTVADMWEVASINQTKTIPYYSIIDPSNPREDCHVLATEITRILNKQEKESVSTLEQFVVHQGLNLTQESGHFNVCNKRRAPGDSSFSDAERAFIKECCSQLCKVSKDKTKSRCLSKIVAHLYKQNNKESIQPRYENKMINEAEVLQDIMTSSRYLFSLILYNGGVPKKILTPRDANVKATILIQLSCCQEVVNCIEKFSPDQLLKLVIFAGYMAESKNPPKDIEGCLNNEFIKNSSVLHVCTLLLN